MKSLFVPLPFSHSPPPCPLFTPPSASFILLTNSPIPPNSPLSFPLSTSSQLRHHSPHSFPLPAIQSLFPFLCSGLYATQPIEKGHVFLTMITGDSLPPPLASLLSPSLSVWACIALFLLLLLFPSHPLPPLSHHPSFQQMITAPLSPFLSFLECLLGALHIRFSPSQHPLPPLPFIPPPGVVGAARENHAAASEAPKPSSSSSPPLFHHQVWWGEHDRATLLPSLISITLLSSRTFLLPPHFLASHFLPPISWPPISWSPAPSFPIVPFTSRLPLFPPSLLLFSPPIPSLSSPLLSPYSLPLFSSSLPLFPPSLLLFSPPIPSLSSPLLSPYSLPLFSSSLPLFPPSLLLFSPPIPSSRLPPITHTCNHSRPSPTPALVPPEPDLRPVLPCLLASTVCSRAWGIEALGNLALVPFADMINHNAHTHTLLCYDEEQQAIEIIADRDYEPGEQVLVSYGDLSSGVLALDFGFTVPNNPHDSVELCVLITSSSTPHDAQLNEAKRRLLVEAQLLPCDSASGACFVLKRIDTPASDGRGLPFALRAMARILTAASDEQLHFLRQEGRQHSGTVGRRPIRAQGGGGGGRGGGGGEVGGVEGWEGRAMELLLSLVEERIEHLMGARQADPRPSPHSPPAHTNLPPLSPFLSTPPLFPVRQL
ncbi:unnamed protein product [Closterium sp. Naga37s-1]|nr:unnamed protein product [Closterium sp. Naga37s-1]